MSDITTTQCHNMLLHFLSGKTLDWSTAARFYGIGAMHRRLTDLRTGRHDGIYWPIDYGKWTERNGKRFKAYAMNMEKVGKDLMNNISKNRTQRYEKLSVTH